MTISANYPSLRPTLLLDFANSEVLDPRITFSRPTTGTYYDGKTVAKAEENLFLRSQEFDNADWNKSSATVTANAIAAPDGTTTADLLTVSAQFGGVSQFRNTISGQQYTISFWALVNTGTNAYSVVDNSGGAGILGTFTPTGTWTRYSFTFTAASGSATLFIAQDRNASGFGSVYLWGAQLEQRSSVTAYTATTTAPITNYVPVLLTAAAGVARFEHNPTTGESLGLEIEEQRTNLLTYSEDFSNAAWTKQESTINANITISPNGTLTADSLIPSTNSVTNHRMQVTSSAVSGSNATSLYAKAAGYGFLKIRLGSFYANFNLNSGVVASTNAVSTISSVGNGWYRCTLISTAAGSDTAYFYVSAVDTAGLDNTAFAGDGFSGLFIWGAQLEAGGFSTSYVPTVASQVTRSADSASMTGANLTSWYRADEGTLYSEAATRSVSVAGVAAGFSDGTQANEILLYTFTTTLYQLVNLNSSVQSNISIAGTVSGTNWKGITSYAVNNFAMSLNGGTVGTDTAGLVPTTINLFSIGRRGDGSLSANGTIKKIAYYPLRLTNTNLVALTGS
jgi:hypothetical protein